MRIVVGRMLRYRLFFLLGWLWHPHNLGRLCWLIVHCRLLLCLYWLLLGFHRLLLFRRFLFLNGLLRFLFLFLSDKGRAVKPRELTEVQMFGEFVP